MTMSTESGSPLARLVGTADPVLLRQLADSTLELLVLLIVALRERAPAAHDEWITDLRRIGLDLESAADHGPGTARTEACP